MIDTSTSGISTPSLATARAGGGWREHRRIRLVHAGEVLGPRQQHRDLHDVVDAASARLDDGDAVLQRLSSLLADARTHELCSSWHPFPVIPET